MGAAALAWASLAVAGVGTVYQIHTTRQQGRAQRRIARYNQRVAEDQALDARRRGQVAERQRRAEIAQLIGRGRAAIGASGVEVDEGSAALLVADLEALGELEALMIRNNAAREAWGYETQAIGFGFEASMAPRIAEQAAFGQALTGASTILSGASQIRGG